MGTFGDSTPVLWSTGLLWDGNDNYQFDDEDEGWQEVGLATEVAEHFHGHVSQSAPEPLILGERRECKISVAELLLVAAHTDQPELNFPDRRKRLAGKQCLKDDVGFFAGTTSTSPRRRMLVSRQCGAAQIGASCLSTVLCCGSWQTHPPSVS